MPSPQDSFTLNESLHSRFQALHCMARRIVHDTNNYYGILQGYISLLEANLPGEELIEKYLPPMKEALQAGIDFNKRLAEFYRESQPMLTEIELPVVVQEVGESYRRAHDLEVDVTIEKEPGIVAVNEPIFRILMEGLCKLAQYTHTRPVRFIIDHVKLPEKDIRAMVFESQPGAYAVISVEYSLEQNTPEAVVACMNPFGFESEHSQDLGLALLYNHLRHHQGNLDVRRSGDSLGIALYYPEREE
jgi:hypothetical protein